MAIPIQDGGLIASRLQSLLRLQGTVRPTLEEFILPTIQVADLSDGAIPSVRRHCSAQFTQAAVVAERCIFRLEVPPNILAHITGFSCRPIAAATSLNMTTSSSLAAADLTGIALSGFIEGRLTNANPPQQPASVLTFGTRVGALAAVVWFKVVNPVPDRSDFEPIGWIVGSGQPAQFGFLEFAVNALNDQMVVNMEWDEYQVF